MPFVHHLDRVTRTLLITYCATGTLIVIDPIALAGTKFDNCILRTGTEAAITFKTVATGQAAARFEQGIVYTQIFKYFVEA